jgi:hypothetical protein
VRQDKIVFVSSIPPVKLFLVERSNATLHKSADLRKAERLAHVPIVQAVQNVQLVSERNQRLSMAVVKLATGLTLALTYRSI